MLSFMCVIILFKEEVQSFHQIAEECKAQRRLKTPILIESNSPDLPNFSVSFVGYSKFWILKKNVLCNKLDCKF